MAKLKQEHQRIRSDLYSLGLERDRLTETLQAINNEIWMLTGELRAVEKEIARSEQAVSEDERVESIDK